MADNVIDYGQYDNMRNNQGGGFVPSPTYSEPRSVTKEKTTVTKEFDSKGRVTKEIKVTEIVTETFQVTTPYTPTWTTTNNSSNVKYGVTLQKAKD